MDIPKIPGHARRLKKYKSFKILDNDDNPDRFPEEQYTIEELRRRLERYSGTHAGSEDIARWAGTGYLWFMEEAESETGESEFLCDILGDMEAQWEMLMANVFDKGGKEAAEGLGFPGNYVSEWISQIDDFLGKSEMRKSDMQTELTLRIDWHLVRQAEIFSEKSGVSVSNLVASYFASLDPDMLQAGQSQV